jgi:F-type H+-transporting ATPase subunit b
MTEHATHPSFWHSLFWPMPVVPNFVLFAALMVYVLRSPIAEFFRARTARLRDGLQAGARARREAEAMRATLKRDIENLPTLRAQLVADLRATAEAQREHLLGVGRKAVDRIREDARLLAEHEISAARHALRTEVIDLAIQEATAHVRRAIRPEDHERFVRDFVSGAGATP